jgi:F1F0 ATPase subunit 2
MTIMADLHLSGDRFALLLSLIAGVALGFFYFGGLWWTVQRLRTARHPAWLAAGSMVVRLAGTLAGFYWIMDGNWARLLTCALGFFAARTVLLYHYSPTRATRIIEEGGRRPTK